MCAYRSESKNSLTDGVTTDFTGKIDGPTIEHQHLE